MSWLDGTDWLSSWFDYSEWLLHDWHKFCVWGFEGLRVWDTGRARTVTWPKLGPVFLSFVLYVLTLNPKLGLIGWVTIKLMLFGRVLVSWVDWAEWLTRWWDWAEELSSLLDGAERVVSRLGCSEWLSQASLVGLRGWKAIEIGLSDSQPEQVGLSDYWGVWYGMSVCQAIVSGLCFWWADWLIGWGWVCGE
jgi:hypothetical protein